MTTKRRTAVLAAVLLSATLALSACGGDRSEDSAGGSTAGYPVTIDTQFGDLTLQKKPERIVVVGSALDVDMLEALGEPADVYGTSVGEEQALSFAPWLDGLYGKYVEGLVTDGFKPAREAIAEQDPDLIVFFGGGAPIDQAGHDQLAEIAPTYAYRSVPPWRKAVTNLARLTGRTDRAEQVIDGIEGEFADARKRLAGLQGKTFFHGVTSPDGIYSVPAVVQFFTEFGLRPAANQPAADQTQTLSPENLDQVDADIVFLGGEGAPRTAIEKDPRFADLPSVRNKTMVFLQPLIEDVAIPSQIGPTSVPWLLQRLVPKLENSPLNSKR